MSRLAKRELMRKVEGAFRASGLYFKPIASSETHPAYYKVYTSDSAFSVRIYIWNITHGGGDLRPPDEYRIQVTGVSEVAADGDYTTLILGWMDEDAVFAGWDARLHQGEVAKSPSMQVKEVALARAQRTGIALNYRSEDEITVAFRPDLMRVYIEHLVDLHNGDETWVEAVNAEIEEASEDEAPLPPEPDTGKPRAKLTHEVARYVRSYSFRRRVLTAYEHACAVCDMQLELVDAAHIVPVRHRESTDETSNGIALCALHHKAFDTSLLFIQDDCRVCLSEPRLKELRRKDKVAGVDNFRSQLRDHLRLPAEPACRPKPTYLALRRELGS